MSVRSEERPVTGDAQGALLAGLIASMTTDTPSVQRLLDLARPHLTAAVGLTAATVFEPDPETGLLNPVARVGEPGHRDVCTAGQVLRLAAGAAPMLIGDRMAVRLRIGGQTVGVLLLAGSRLAALEPGTLGQFALHIAATLQGIAAEKQRQFVSHATTTIRRLFEEGMAATSVEAAGRVLAASAAAAFRTEFGTVFLIDAEGRINYVQAVSGGRDLPPHDLVGRRADESGVWRRVLADGPALVNNADSIPSMTGGLIKLLGLRSYVAIPMMSGQGAVGLIVCGDASGHREWTSRDRMLADQLSVEGALIVDSARMRQAAQAHVAELSHQAFHDSLTGLPNRPFLLDRAQFAVHDAAARSGRVALLMLDLNGFKDVNDTAGHQTGDRLLQQVGQRLLGAVRDDDVVARLGGDEFAILLGHDPDEQITEAVAQRICDRLREPFVIDGRTVQIGGSVGFALCPGDATTYDELMRGADAAMYAAKHETKGLGGGVRRAG